MRTVRIYAHVYDIYGSYTFAQLGQCSREEEAVD